MLPALAATGQTHKSKSFQMIILPCPEVVGKCRRGGGRGKTRERAQAHAGRDGNGQDAEAISGGRKNFAAMRVKKHLQIAPPVL